MKDNNFLIGALELQSELQDPDLRIVDCRFQLLDPGAGRSSYEEAHIPGAVYADLDRDLAGPVGAETGRHPLPEVATLSDTFSRLGIDRHTRVVAYDDSSGAIAARAWWLLRWLGHENVRLLDGGIAAWSGSDLPLQAGETRVRQRRFEATPRNELVLTTQDILEAGDPMASLRLVDARDRARFNGEVEPIDPVAGHVPGALNLPFSASLDAEGYWRPAAELATALGSVLGEGRNQPWAVMCGSGVTACHLAIAGLLAGHTEPRVYVGSWSEWIADPARKIATGEN